MIAKLDHAAGRDRAGRSGIIVRRVPSGWTGIRRPPRERPRSGQIAFLEKGSSRAGLQHIVERHAGDFANVGVPQDKVAKLVFAAVTTGKVVGAQRTRPIYEVLFEGKLHKLGVSVGDNGFIAGANPVGH